MFGGKSSALDGKTNLVTDDVQQLQFFLREFAPVCTGHIQYTNGSIARVDRNASVEAQSQRGRILIALSIFQAAAAQDIYIGSALQVAGHKGIQAQAEAGHPLRMIREIRRKGL